MTCPMCPAILPHPLPGVCPKCGVGLPRDLEDDGVRYTTPDPAEVVRKVKKHPNNRVIYFA